MNLALLGAASIASWYLLVRAASARGQHLAPWFVVAHAAVLLVLYGTMQLPYKLANDPDEFPQITWRGQVCHVMGQRRDQALLFCAGSTPRRRIVNTEREPLPPLGDKTHLFAAFN